MSGFRASRLGRLSWTMFDWANQPFYTLIMTFVFAVYFTDVFITGDDGAQKFTLTQTISGIAIAILSPILGSISDLRGNRKRWMALWSVLFVIGMGLLWYAYPGAPNGIWLVMFGLILASTAVGFGEVFNNSMLTNLETKENMGILSGLGFGLGYIAGLIGLIIFLLFFVWPGGETNSLYGLNTSEYEHIRIIGPLCAVWYAFFIIPLFLFTPDTKSNKLPVLSSIKQGTTNLIKTFKELKNFKNIFTFLIARLFFQDALNALFVIGGIYASQVIGMTLTQVLILGIILNLFAGPSSILGGYFNDRIGSKNVINISLWGLLISGLLALSIDQTTIFYFIEVAKFSPEVERLTMGIFNSTSQVVYTFVVIGIATFFGPTQTASRALMVKISPPEKAAEFFGLYAFAGKSTSWLVPGLMSIILIFDNNLRNAMLVIMLFNILGIIMMRYVKEDG
ncbi:MAG: MFS transporter [Candidatus Pelagibacterales bacterium]|jgi:UMF1 family MFS transporter|tara:strand:- start:2 stop:1357 length:1356 start_codon:yes stop_codon:yes gene_type:complete